MIDEPNTTQDATSGEQRRPKKLTLNRATVKRLSIGEPGLQPPAPGTANSPQCPNPNLQ